MYAFSIVEKNTMASVLLNALFTRLSLNGAVMLISYLKATWPDIKLPYKYEYLLQNGKLILKSNHLF